MSLISTLLRDFYDPWDRRGLWDELGPRITPEEIRMLSIPDLTTRAANRRQLAQRLGGESKSAVGKDGFQVCMDVQQFRPNEITVKTVDDNTVVVEGKHEERPDEHGFISRQFVRKYTLPKGYDAKEVVSTLSSDGVLTVKAPPPQKTTQDNTRVIQIQQTGPAHLNIKDNPKEKGQGEAAGNSMDAENA